MKKYILSFKGREVNAIGIFYKIKETFYAIDAIDLYKQLYNKYEHVSELKIVLK
jgi:hypothetical protein